MVNGKLRTEFVNLLIYENFQICTLACQKQNGKKGIMS